MEGQEIQQEILQEPQDANVSAEETSYSGAEETESPPVETQDDDGQGAAAQPEETPEQQRAKRESKGVQKRIDELVRQREEANRRVDYLMGLVAQVSQRAPGEKPAPAAAPVEEQPPKESDFQDYESFLDAKAEFKARKAAKEAEAKILAQVQQTLAQERQARQAEKESASAQSWVNAGSARYADFAETVLADDVRISPHMRDVILADPVGHEVAYWLGKNPDAAARISQLPPLRQAQEIGRISARFETQASSKPSQPRPTTAPAPVKPVGSKATVSKDPSRMSMEEFIAYRNASGKR